MSALRTVANLSVQQEGFELASLLAERQARSAKTPTTPKEHSNVVVFDVAEWRLLMP